VNAKGFSLLEVLVAMAITVTITAAVLSIISPSQGIALRQPEFADVQQRLRVGVDTLRHDLLMAGAGSYAGTQSGSLVGFFAPVMPYSRGASAARDDGPGVFRADVVTIVYVPSTASQTTLRTPMADAASADINVESGCPVSDAACGFGPGTSVVVYDRTGAFDVFAVTNAGAGGLLALQHLQRGPLAASYAVGAKIAEVVRRTYFFDAAAKQLMRYEGGAASYAVLENVAGLTFDYYGDPEPPAFSRPGIPHSVTYGPPPPPLEVSQAPWPPGENCTWRVVGVEQAPRLISLGGAGELVRLTPAQLTDGPWCPHAASENRFDADLLRIRKIRVSIRLQAGNPLLRVATSLDRAVPDQSIEFDVVPRNMSLSR